MAGSVAQVENIDEAISGLQSTYNSMDTSCNAQITAVDTKLVEVQQ